MYQSRAGTHKKTKTARLPGARSIKSSENFTNKMVPHKSKEEIKFQKVFDDSTDSKALKSFNTHLKICKLILSNKNGNIEHCVTPKTILVQDEIQNN